MRRIALIVLFCTVAFMSAAQDSDDKSRQWQATLYGGLYLNNEQAWQLEPSVSWFFHKYIGVSLGIEFTSQYNQPTRPAVIHGHKADLADNELNIGWIIFKPSIVFRSPAIWKDADNYCRLWFQAEPGISLGCPFHNSLTYEIMEIKGSTGYPVDYVRFQNKGLQWLYWNARASVNFAIHRFVIGAGYSVSNLDYYSGRRNVTLPSGHKFQVPRKEISQSIFLSLGYCF